MRPNRSPPHVPNRVLEQFATVVNGLTVPERAIPKGKFDYLGRSPNEPFRLPIGVTADACLLEDGRPAENALWLPAERRLVLCYGLVRLLDNLSRSTIASTEIGQHEVEPGLPPSSAPAR
jgi:hypothetical protein